MTSPSRTSGLRDHAGYWLDRLRERVHFAFEGRIARHDVTVAQWCVLIALYKGDAATPLELARFINVDPGATTRLVDRLVAKGLVLREQAPGDRRSIRLALTAKGRAITPRLAALADENDATFFSALTPTELREFKRLLAKLLDAQGIAAPELDADTQTAARRRASA